MKMILLSGLFSLFAASASACPALLDHEVRKLAGDETVNLCDAYSGKVLLIVNTASRCGFTDQYDDLEALYKKYKSDGLVVLGFPSNDFGAQEPGTEKEIRSFCRLTYGVQFPMFAKTRVSQYGPDPLYRDLAASAGRFPSWNFHKYLLGRDGALVADFASAAEPLGDDIVGKIEQALKVKF